LRGFTGPPSLFKLNPPASHIAIGLVRVLPPRASEASANPARTPARGCCNFPITHELLSIAEQEMTGCFTYLWARIWWLGIICLRWRLVVHFPHLAGEPYRFLNPFGFPFC
jgi:hypothetical protein